MRYYTDALDEDLKAAMEVMDRFFTATFGDSAKNCRQICRQTRFLARRMPSTHSLAAPSD